MRGPSPAAGAPVAVATLPSRGLPRGVQFSVAKNVQFSMARSVQLSMAIDTWERPYGRDPHRLTNGGESPRGGAAM